MPAELLPSRMTGSQHSFRLMAGWPLFSADGLSLPSGRRPAPMDSRPTDSRRLQNALVDRWPVSSAKAAAPDGRRRSSGPKHEVRAGKAVRSLTRRNF